MPTVKTNIPSGVKVCIALSAVILLFPLIIAKIDASLNPTNALTVVATNDAGQIETTYFPLEHELLILTNTINAAWITQSAFTISDWLTATSDENWSPSNTVLLSTIKPIVVKTNDEWQITFEPKR